MQLNRFFLNNGYPYSNPHGIEFLYRPEDTSVMLCCRVPGLVLPEKEMTVELYTRHASLLHFISEYIVTTPKDLKALTPRLMLKCFLVGRATLVCYLDGNAEHFLHFKGKAGILWAKDNEDQKHPVRLFFMQTDC